MTAAIVIPVRDARADLGPCVEAIRAALDADATVVVVDDGSTDGTAELATRIADQFIEAGGVGPYQARNLGWEAVDADLIAFLDVRCRARRGWLAEHAATLLDPDVAVSGGDAIVRSGTSIAERFQYAAQPYRVRYYLEHPHGPYVPTCNLATRREVLEKVGGFRPVRSGGDAAFCWDVRDLGLGLIARSGATVDMEPRRSVGDVVRQFRKYGTSRAWLEQEYGYVGVPSPVEDPHLPHASPEASPPRSRAVSSAVLGRVVERVMAGAYRRAKQDLARGNAINQPVAGDPDRIR